MAHKTIAPRGKSQSGGAAELNKASTKNYAVGVGTSDRQDARLQRSRKSLDPSEVEAWVLGGKKSKP